MWNKRHIRDIDRECELSLQAAMVGLYIQMADVYFDMACWIFECVGNRCVASVRDGSIRIASPENPAGVIALNRDPKVDPYDDIERLLVERPWEKR